MITEVAIEFLEQKNNNLSLDCSQSNSGKIMLLFAIQYDFALRIELALSLKTNLFCK